MFPISETILPLTIPRLSHNPKHPRYSYRYKLAQLQMSLFLKVSDHPSTPTARITCPATRGSAKTYRLMSSWQAPIFWNRVGSPMILAAFLTSRHVSSRRVMTRTMVPSMTSVKSVIRLNDMPRAHSYTTSTMPKRGLLIKSFESSADRMTWCSVWILFTFSEISTIFAMPRSRLAVNVGSVLVFSWKTKAESSATISSGSYSARTFSRTSSVRTSSSAE
jgi:hypothetical protein